MLSEAPHGAAPVRFIHTSRIGRGVIDFFTGEPEGGNIPSGNNPIPGLAGPLPGTGECPGVFSVRGPNGTCINLTDLAPGGAPAVTGRAPSNGAGVHSGDHAPAVIATARRQCNKGSVLGTDGLCHETRDIRNNQRMYPKPRAPLGTSGDLNAVTKAARFGRRLKSNEKKLKKLSRTLSP